MNASLAALALMHVLLVASPKETANTLSMLTSASLAVLALKLAP